MARHLADREQRIAECTYACTGVAHPAKLPDVLRCAHEAAVAEPGDARRTALRRLGKALTAAGVVKLEECTWVTRQTP